MIPRTEPLVHAISWQSELANSVTSLKELLEATENHAAHLDQQLVEKLDFPIKVPRPYLSRIQPGNPHDPLLKQVLPLALESIITPGYLTDPLEEADSHVPSGIIHKYQGRVLLVLTGTCAINCRYCFRRHFPYENHQNSMRQWQQTLDYIRQNHSISEIIYSGGDPLANNDSKLAQLTQSIAQIPHVKRLRIHTRLPVVIPQRVTDSLLEWLTATRLQTSIVLHTNHANELDKAVEHSLRRLRQAQICLLNQSVILKGVNDNSQSLIALSERLFEMGVLPYYLHLMDKVQGAAHFDITTHQAQKIVGEMAAQLPGYLVPKLVKEIPGRESKIPLMPAS